ncbi:MAG: glycosyltransferase family 4 protein [Gemmatimonadetes bacterium]|nr:glycosyltransferase family 4 protein [Gemmatimonadota bacterium]
MRIAMHCIYFFPEVGGLESHVHLLARALVERGHAVDMVTSRSLPGLPRHEGVDGIRVWRTWFPARRPAGWIAFALASIPRFLGVSRGADVVHSQTFASVPPVAAARRLRGTPMVLTLHTSHFLRLARRPLWRPILRRLVREADYVLATSVEIAEVAEALAPGVRVERIVNAVETSVFRRVTPALPSPERRRVIVPRRLFPKNGVEYFVRAVPGLLKALPIEAIVVGDGPERPRLERLAQELGVAGHIRFLGARPHAEMPGYLSWGEVAIFPSLLEATSVAALEAMACELPVAASRVGGLPEIVDESVGVLFEPANPEDMVEKVIELLRRDDLRAMGERARDRVVERWSSARLAERHLKIYRMLLASREGNVRGG